MQRFTYISFVVVVLLAQGCYYARIVAGSDAKDFGETVQTQFRYRLICDGDGGNDELLSQSQRMQKYQPGVFDDDGIPVVLSFQKTIDDNDPGAMSIRHSHRRCSISVAGQYLASVEACGRDVMALGFLPPIPVLKMSFSCSPCFQSGHVLGSNSFGSYSDFIRDCYDPQCYDYCDMAMAYGIASRLKEAEDEGRIDEISAASIRSTQSLADAVSTRAKIRAESKMRQGVGVKSLVSENESPFEIVRCDSEQGRDFAYSFTLRKRGGGAISLSDYGIIRNGFRSAIRSQYASAHPNVNPRTLVIDFTEYALKGGVVCGRVAVLTISAESMTYDAASRKGIIMVRVGDGQFEDARRWIRRNLAALAGRSNIALVGDAVPSGARFYSESEEMSDGLLKISFKTE